MGTIALMKQTFMDAEWYIRARDAYEKGGRAGLPPETSEALDALGDVVRGHAARDLPDGERGGIPPRVQARAPTTS